MNLTAPPASLKLQPASPSLCGRGEQSCTASTLSRVLDKIGISGRVVMLPFQHLSKSNTIDNLWLYILSLAKKEPVYAYRLQKDIEAEFGFHPGKITPYRVLYRLGQDGFVKSGMKERRRIYQITEKGKKELKKAKELYQKALKFLS